MDLQDQWGPQVWRAIKNGLELVVDVKCWRSEYVRTVLQGAIGRRV
jgi:hypothetical protein